MTHLAATLYINSLYQSQYPKIALAGETGFVDNVINGIKSYVSEKWDPEKPPLASIIAFMGPGLIFKLGFPWLAVAYEVADALGFNWVGFWDSLKNYVYDIVKGVISPGSRKPTDDEVHQQLTSATEEALQQNIHETVDEAKLQKAYEKSQDGIKTAEINGPYFMKEAGILGAAVRSRGVLSTLFKKIIPWVVTRALISLGFVVAGGALRGAVGLDSKKNGPEADAKLDGEGPASTVRDPIHDLKISPNVDPDLYEFNKNDASSVWLENGNIDNIRSILIDWILSAFPDLDKEKDKITSAPGFIEVENMFRNRNKLAHGLQIYSVPKPFQRKIDVVSYIVNGYLKSKK